MLVQTINSEWPSELEGEACFIRFHHFGDEGNWYKVRWALFLENLSSRNSAVGRVHNLPGTIPAMASSFSIPTSVHFWVLTLAKILPVVSLYIRTFSALSRRLASSCSAVVRTFRRPCCMDTAGHYILTGKS